MSKMDNQKLKVLLKEIGLGYLTRELEVVTGGLIHKMWHATTDQDEFAVKQLNPTIMTRHRARCDILGGEEIARGFAKNGISVSSALCFDGETILKAGEAEIMLFEWVNGITLEDNVVTSQHCLQIGELFGEMHKCRIAIENFALPASCVFDKDHWADLIERAKTNDWINEVQAALPDLIRFSAEYAEALPLLQSEMVASHRDLDIKNVMWNSDNNPIIIDWEAAGLVNPMWELVDAALNWCGQTSGKPDKERFQMLISGYLSVQPMDAHMIGPTFAGCIGARMEWMEFNMQRSINSDRPSEERMLGGEQVVGTLSDILSLAENKPDFVNWLQSSL